ncbi:MAG: hypothetical protein PHV68_03705 [Candidatus Gastranaerophilales bacterium]|nr:hypothetical protein [Candidatus Gastranaerophilales bacterium]
MKILRYGLTTVKSTRWTIAAIECYERKCICESCFYHNFFKNSGHKCKMKFAVIGLVRKLGKPTIKLNDFTDKQGVLDDEIVF